MIAMIAQDIHEAKIFFGLTEIANRVSQEVAEFINETGGGIEDEKAAYFAVERELMVTRAVGWNGKVKIRPREGNILENKLKDLVAVHLLTEQMLKMKEELK